MHEWVAEWVQQCEIASVIITKFSSRTFWNKISSLTLTDSFLGAESFFSNQQSNVPSKEFYQLSERSTVSDEF